MLRGRRGGRTCTILEDVVRRDPPSLGRVLTTLAELLLAPALVGLATVASRRWNEQVGGLVSAFPAIVGPLLLITAHQHGAAFTARAATGTLAGLVALGGFALVYARVAQSARWPAALASAWVVAVALSALAGTFADALPAALVAAATSLTVAYLALPAAPSDAGRRPPVERQDVGKRMAITLVLVAVLDAAAGRFGALAGGLLAALPVLASVLAVTTHDRQGGVAALDLLRGMLAGMGGFMAFCAVVAALAEPVGVGGAFALALLAAVSAQILALAMASQPGLPHQSSA